MRILLALAVCVFSSFSNSSVQVSTTKQSQKPDAQVSCPMMQDTHSQMNVRGEKGMGFSQTATTHHFFLTANGGVIQVEANEASDAVNRDAIRMHLRHIADAFGKGDFNIPMFVHDTVPPGVPEMKTLRNEIHYTAENLPNGARVIIASTNKAAINAIHDFMRFQIEEHRTGDSTEIRQSAP